MVKECEIIPDMVVPSTAPEQRGGGVMEFVGDAATCGDADYSYPSNFLQPTAVGSDLKEYFSRPRIIATGSVPTTIIPAAELNMTVSSIFSTYFPNGLIRLAGVHGVRFTMRFDLTVSNQPFQQGLLVLSYQPLIGANDSVGYSRSTRSQSCTFLPHTRLNLSDSTMCSLDVPFNSFLDYLPLYGDLSTTNLGHVAVNAVLPYRTAGTTTTPTYKLYVSLHDMELIGATTFTANSIVTQSGIKDVGIRKVMQSYGQPAHDKESFLTKAAGSTLQFAATSVLGPAAVPMLSAVGGTARWLSSALGGAAAAFGFSSPLVTNHVVRHVNAHSIGEIHVDVPSVSDKLSIFQANSLTVDPVMGMTDIDEMSMKHVLSKYSQIFQGNLTTTDSTNTFLYASQVCPSSFWYKSGGVLRPGGNTPIPAASTVTTNCIQPSTITYVADHFRYWRGGLKFKFTFAKTPFHGGRIMVGFVPFYEYSNNTPVTNTVPALEISGLPAPQPSSYTKIFDLREGSEFEFEVPYLSEFLYTGVFDSIGGISMVVLDPLVVSSASASTTVDYLVEVAALDDFEFSSIVSPSLVPVHTSIGLAFLQSGLPVAKTPVDVNPYTSGEKVMSLKQLAMIPYRWTVDSVSLSIITPSILPWWYSSTLAMTAPMAVNIAANQLCTHANKVAAMFTWANGSTRFNAVPNNPGQSGSMMTVIHRPDPGNTVVTGAGNYRNKRAFNNSQPSIISPIHIHCEVPTYSKTARVPIESFNNSLVPRNYINTEVSANNSIVQSLSNFVVRNTGASQGIWLSSSAGEDARCASFIGPPPIILFNSLSATSPNSDNIFV